jgi:hypothetical protein
MAHASAPDAEILHGRYPLLQHTRCCSAAFAYAVHLCWSGRNGFSRKVDSELCLPSPTAIPFVLETPSRLGRVELFCKHCEDASPPESVRWHGRLEHISVLLTDQHLGWMLVGSAGSLQLLLD